MTIGGHYSDRRPRVDFDQELLAPRYRAVEEALGLLARRIDQTVQQAREHVVGGRRRLFERKIFFDRTDRQQDRFVDPIIANRLRQR